MRHLRSLVIGALVVVGPSALTAQDDDGSFLERTIQNALSGAGREVRITGFSGALSSSATMEELTISDADGVWLTLNDAQLDWRRAALLRGRLELDALTAASIRLERLPAADAPEEEEETGFRLPSLPPPEATQFALPELPVSIRVGEISIASLVIGEPVLGQTIEATLSGSAALDGGEGDVSLNLERTDDREGAFVVAGSYANSSEVLSVRLSVAEAEGGVVAKLLNVPDSPSLDLNIAGEGPLSDFRADIGLRTDDVDRLTGAVEFGSTTTDDDRVQQSFGAVLAGDITPLLQPDYRDFIGEDLNFQVAGIRSEVGGLDLNTLRLDAAELDLEGSLSLGPDAWPRQVDIRGQIAPLEGDSVLLAIPGPPTRLSGVNLSFAFDEAENDGWLLSLIAEDVTRDGFALGSVLLGGQGGLEHGEGELVGRADGQISATISGLDLGDAALTAAIGSDLQAQMDFVLEEDAPFRIGALSVDGPDYGLQGDLTITVPEGSPSPEIDGQFTVNADDIARFAEVAGQPVSGAVRVNVTGDVVPLDGAFDLVVTGETEDLAIGIDQVDPLLAGVATVSVDARRDGGGTFVDALTVRSEQADISGAVAISSGATSGEIRAQIPNTSIVHPDMSGAATVDGVFSQSGNSINADLTVRGPGGTTADVTARTPDGAARTTVDAQISSRDLSVFAWAVGQPIDGSARFDLNGDVAAEDGSFDLNLSGTTNNLAVGIEQADAILAGRGTLSVAARRDGTDLFVDQLAMRTPQADITGDVTISDGTTSGDVRASLPDASVLHPEMFGDVLIDATFDQTADRINADLSLRAPGGTRAEVTARTADGSDQTMVDASVATRDLSVFAWAVGQPLNGSARFDISGDVTPQAGEFDLDVSGSARDLAIGIEQVDALIAGESVLSASAQREGTDIIVEDLIVRNPQLDVTGDVSIRDGTTAGQVRAAMPDATVLHPDMTGNVLIDGTFAQSGTAINADVTVRAPGEIEADIRARTPDESKTTSFDVALAAQDLSVYAWAAGQPIAGALDIRAEGDANLSSGAAAARLDGSLNGLRTGIAEADALLAGVVKLVLDAARDEDGEIMVSQLDVTGDRLNAQASGTVGGNRSEIDYSVSIPNFGVVLPNLPGELASDGSVTTTGEVYGVNSTLTGPGGLSAALEGTVMADASQAEISVRGTAPLSLANTSLAPNIIQGPLDFDIRLNGPLEVGSVRGTVSTNGATMSLPTAGVAIRSIDSNVTLGNGQAQLDVSVSPEPFGEIRVTGPITLTNPFRGDLSIVLDNLGIARAGLVETAADGQLRVSGPLTGGAEIAGRINFDEVAVQVPSSSGAASASIPGLKHVSEPSAVRQTRSRAGLVEKEDVQAGPSTPPYGLNVTISAPSRVFIRGRGLDAEMGGTFNIGGTTEQIVPSGRFELIRGRLNLLGQRVELTEGYIEPQGDLDPYMEIVAEARSGEIDVRIRIEGEVSDPELTITSSPELPEDEVLARFLFGRDLSEISTIQALQIADAIAALNGSGPGTFGRIRNSLGLDDLDVSTSETGETTVRAGRYLSENIYSDVARTTDGQTEINLNLELTPTLTARGKARSDNTTALGIFLERDY